MNVIEVRNLKKYFGKTHAVDDISFDVQKGEIFGFLGPNGAGKTTTIRCLMDLLRPDGGQINIFGLDSTRGSIKIKENVGFLSGDVRLYDGWTGKEHILLLESIHQRGSIADKLIETLNFNPGVKCKNLSSGNRQKLGLILALMFEPELLIMDEPTLGLDPLLQNKIYELLEEFQKKQTTIFISSHNLTEVDRLCSRVGIIKNGKLIAVEGIKDLKSKRMYVVKVSFASPFNSSDFVLPNFQIRQELPDGLILGVKEDINPLMQKLSSYQIKELEISRASLEEIFLEFYGNSSQLNQSVNYPEVEKRDVSNPPPNHNNDLMDIPKLQE